MFKYICLLSSQYPILKFIKVSRKNDVLTILIINPGVSSKESSILFINIKGFKLVTKALYISIIQNIKSSPKNIFEFVGLNTGMFYDNFTNSGYIELGDFLDFFINS